MKKQFTQIAFFLVGGFFLVSFSVIADLQDHLAGLEDGDQLSFEYSFEGCYGPYHHGRIDFNSISDTIFYTEKSYDDKGKEGLSQSGKYERSRLLDLLRHAEKTKSKEIYGNTITYRIAINTNEIRRGADRIEQRHFIEIFQPFTSVFSKGRNTVIPGLKTGGFVH
ncbi:MAG: hypothetical protein IPL46_23480 [Saprospiraceae bacterium]|nr:hypothetical protein [Saprospiraceae bacterium]